MMDKFKIIYIFIKHNLAIIFIVLFVLVSGFAIRFYAELSNLKDNPQIAVHEETLRLIEQVSKLVVLPDNEEPAVATISDIEQLKNYPFFAQAKKGFKVLIYANAKKSILYDPFQGRVVEIASFNTGEQPKLSPNP